MNKVITILAMSVCLAGLTTCEVSQPAAIEVDFSGLGILLVDKLKDNTDSQANFAFLEEHVQELSEPEKKAFEILKQLRDTKACSDEAIRLLASAVEAGLAKVFANGKGKAEERIAGLIDSDLQGLNTLCEDYIAQTLQARVSSADAKLKQFVDMTKPKDIQSEGMKTDRASLVYYVSDDFKTDSPLAINSTLLAGILNDLAALGGEKQDWGLDMIVERPRTYGAATWALDHMFKKYLVEPCKKFAAHYDPLFDGVHAITSLVDPYAFVSRHSVQFRQLAYTNKICKAVQILNAGESRPILGYNKDQIVFKMVGAWPMRLSHNFPSERGDDREYF